jgi:hypothetical protein
MKAGKLLRLNLLTFLYFLLKQIYSAQCRLARVEICPSMAGAGILLSE